jgi:hypothetical protein
MKSSRCCRVNFILEYEKTRKPTHIIVFEHMHKRFMGKIVLLDEKQEWLRFIQQYEHNVYKYWNIAKRIKEF